MDEDSLMEDAVLYLQKKTYHVWGQAKMKKRILRRKAERFALEAGELLYTGEEGQYQSVKVTNYSQVHLTGNGDVLNTL